LLEKYDNKLDELQEENELKDMKIFEYETQYLGQNQQKIRIESIEEKCRFLVQVLVRLKHMYVEGAKSQSGECPVVTEQDLHDSLGHVPIS
jgi:hypothetical protein